MALAPMLDERPRAAAGQGAPPTGSGWVLLTNPGSFRMSLGQRARALESLASDRGIPALRVSDADSISAAIACVADRRAAFLALASGDGTMQAVVTALMRNVPEGRRPAVLLLGGGRGNFIARDLGSAGDVLAVFTRALDGGGERLQRHRRAVLRMRQASGLDQCGFLAAGAMVGEVIRDCHDYRVAGSGWLRTGRPATQWRLLQLAALAALGRRRFAAPGLQIDAGPLGRMDGPVRLLVCSSLAHAGGLFSPFAARGAGPVRLTAVQAGAAGAWRRVPGLLFGRCDSAMQPVHGYLSGRCEQLSITGIQSLVIDGQFHAVDRDLPVQFSAGEALEFLLP